MSGERLNSPKLMGLDIASGSHDGFVRPGDPMPLLRDADKARLILKIPPYLAARDRQEWIETALKIMQYPLVDEGRVAYGSRFSALRIARSEGVAVTTTDGFVCPAFQFDYKGEVHWIVRNSHNYLRDHLKRASFWVNPNADLGGSVPAALLGTEKQFDIPPVLKNLPRN